MSGLTRDANHLYQWNGGDPIPSVTTIIGILDKSGPLVGWAKREVGNAAVRNLDVLAKMVETAGSESAARWLATIPGYQRDTAANRGSDVHALAEALSRGQEVPIPEEIAPYLDAFQAWRREWTPRYIAAEEMVCSLRYGYAGTLDAIVEIAGETWLVDYKTSKGVYPDTALQLAAYAHADFIGRPGIAHKFRLPKATQYAVLHLTRDGYEFIPFDVTADTFKAFLAARDLWAWREGAAKRVIRQPLGPRIARAS